VTVIILTLPQLRVPRKSYGYVARSRDSLFVNNRYSGGRLFDQITSRRRTLHRLFSTFPSGSQGVGLLLLRAAVGVLAIIRGAVSMGDGGPHSFAIHILGLLALASGVALLAGFLTPIAGGLAVLGAIGMALSWFSLPPATQFETNVMTCLVLVVAVAVILLGPGSLSLDARLFGRREIIIPRAPRPPKP
jgi:hypothetical protein